MRWRLLLPRALRAIALAAAVASGTVDLAHAQGVDVNVEIRLAPGLADLERTLQHATGIAFIHLTAEFSKVGMGLREVFAGGALPFDEIGNPIQLQPVDA